MSENTPAPESIEPDPAAANPPDPGATPAPEPKEPAPAPEPKSSADPDPKAPDPDLEPKEPAADDWRTGLPDDLREFASRIASPADAVKMARDLRQKLSGTVKVPGKNASEEDKTAFLKAIGVPDKDDGYQFEMPEGKEATDADVAFQGAMASVMREAGVPVDAAKAMNAKWNELVTAAEEESERIQVKAREDAEAANRKLWGADYDANKTLAQRAYQTFADDELASFLEETKVNGSPMGDHPALLRAFATIGRRMGDGEFIGAATADEKASVEEEIETIMRDNPPGTDKYKSQTVQKRLRELNEKLYGTGPIVGAGGRSA